MVVVNRLVDEAKVLCVQAVFTAHSYLHFQPPHMPFLTYSRPASSGQHDKAPSAVRFWDVLPSISQWADSAESTQPVDQPSELQQLRRVRGTGEAAVSDAVQLLLLATSSYVEAQCLAGTGKVLEIESLAHTSGTTVQELARSQSRFTDKVVYLADVADSQLDAAILALELKQPGALKSHAGQPAPSLSGVWNSRIANAGTVSATVSVLALRKLLIACCILLQDWCP